MGSSMTSSDDYAVQNLRLATGHLMAAIGFNSTSNECLDIMTDLMCRFMKKVSAESKLYAEHAGRTQLALTDLTLAFRKMRFNTVEMYDYMKHVNKQPTKHVCKPVPLFPVARPNSKAIYGPQPGDKELETRPEHIPAHLPAVHPEWTTDSVDYLNPVDQKPSTSVEKKPAKSAPDFPSFHGKTSVDLCLHLLEKESTSTPLTSRKNDSSATGITSSANLSSRNLTDSPLLSGTAKKKLGLHRERTYTPSPVPPKTNSPAPSLSKREDKPPDLIPAKSEDKPFKLKLKFDTPKTPQKPKEESLSPMPTLEKGDSTDYDGYDLPRTPKKENGDSRNGSQPLTPSLTQRVDNDLIASNMKLFATLKAEAERERLKKLEKEEKDRKKEKRREEQKQKKLKKQKEEEIKVKAAIAEAEKRKADEEERKRKIAEEEERKRREEAEKRAKEEEKKRLEEERRKEEEEIAKKQLQKLEKERKLLEEAKKETDFKPLKILISKPKSDRPSVAYSPTTVGHVNDDEDTTPFYESGVEENGPTTFNLNMSINETSSKEKKKHKKRDKERDSSKDRLKDKKREKDHKEKKKKREKDRGKEDKSEKEKKDAQKEKHKSEKAEKRLSAKVEEMNKSVTPAKIEPELKIPTLKIRLGNQTPSSSDMSPPLAQEAPVKLKFKVPSPDKKEERTVPPIQIRMPVAPQPVAPSDQKKNEYEVTPEKKKLVTKAELKASPSEFVRDAQREKDEKRKRKEEKRKKEEEEKEKEKQRLADKEREKNVEALRKKQEEQSIQRKTSKKNKPMPTPKPPAVVPPPVVAPPVVAKIATFDFLGDSKPAPKKEDSVATDEEEIWICPACSVAWTEGADMVACDQCDDWFHWHCVGLLVAPAPDKKWYCQKCELKLKKKSEKRFSTKADGEPSAKKKKKS